MSLLTTDKKTIKEWRTKLSKLSEFERNAKETMEIPAENIIDRPNTTVHALGPGPNVGLLCFGWTMSGGKLEFTYKPVTCKRCRERLGYKD